MVYPLFSSKATFHYINPYTVSTSGVEDHVVSKVFSTLVALPHGGATLAIGLTGNRTLGQVKDLNRGVGAH